MNDQLDLVLVLLIFFVAISYLNFLAVRLRNKSGWSNVTCNPVNLFSNSLFQTREESNKEFKRCVEKLSTEATKTIFSQEAEKQKKVLEHQDFVDTKYTTFDKNITGYKTKVDEGKASVTTDKTAINTSIKNANDLNATTTEKVKSYLSNIQSIFQNIRNYI